mgnify:FL=1
MKLRKLIKLLYDDKTIPCDIIDWVNEEIYSSTAKENIIIGDMDLIHYVRSTNKTLRENNDTENARKLFNIKNILNN